MKRQRYKSVFDAIEQDPAVAENLKIRAALMHELKDFIEADQLTQARAAEVFDVDQPRVSDLVTGKIDKFTIDALVSMLTRAGKQVRVTVKAA